MGAMLNEEKYKNMEMELEHLKNYIQKQNKYYKGLIQKEEQKRKEIEGPLKQKVGEQIFKIGQLNRQNKEMGQLIGSKDIMIRDLSVALEQLESELQYDQNVRDNFQKTEASLNNQINDAKETIKMQEITLKRNEDHYEAEISRARALQKQAESSIQAQWNIYTTELRTAKEENNDLKQKQLGNLQSQTINRLENENRNLRMKINQAVREKDAAVNAQAVERLMPDQMGEEVQLRASFLIENVNSLIRECEKERKKLSSGDSDTLEWIEHKLAEFVSEFQGNYILTDCFILLKLQDKVKALQLALDQRNEDVARVQRSNRPGS